MKRLLVAALLFAAVTLQAQETYTYASPDREFYEGKELFAQKKYAASMLQFEQFLKNGKHFTDPELVQQAHYFIACDAYQLRKSNAADLLETYLKRYPYTLAEAKVCLMIGNLYFEKKQYNLADEYYERCKENQLTKEESHEWLFNKGYVLVQKADYERAKPLFLKLRNEKTKYSTSASYFYAYCEYAQKEYDAALEHFMLIETQPEYSGFVPYYIIQIYFYQKNYTALVPYAEKTLQANPQNANNMEVYRILGELAYENKDYPKAIEHLSQYAKVSPKLLRNDMYILGMSYYHTADYKNAIAYLSKTTTDKDSLTQNAYLHLGNSYVQQGEKGNARMSFRAAAEMDFDATVQEEAAYNYALATYENTTPFGEAISAFDAFLADYPQSKYRDRVYEKLVAIYMTSKDYAAAAASLEKLENPNPEMRDAKAYISFQLGTENFVREEYDKAIADFDKSLSEGTANFKNAQVYYWRGESYYLTGNYHKAVQDFTAFFTKKGADEFPDSNTAHYALGYAYFQQKEYEKACISFLKYIENETNTSSSSPYADALDRLGDCYFAARDFANAEKYYSLSIEKGTKNGDYASFQKAFVLGLQKNYQAKITGLQKLLKDYPMSDYEDDARYEMARAYVLLDQQAQAVESYQSLRQKFPESPLARKAELEIAMLYYNAGKYDEAIAACKQVVKDYPNSEETRIALETMEDIYIEKNAVADYFTYTRTLDENIVKTSASKEDSLTYLAAANLYMKNDIPAATRALSDYVKRFCPSGVSCMQAQYYLADCYFNSGEKDLAFEQYKALAEREGNPYEEIVLSRLAALSYDMMDYETALKCYKRLLLIAQDAENVAAARIGILRCSYLMADAQNTIAMADSILLLKSITKELENEARFYAAKSYIRLEQADKAQVNLTLLAKDLRTPIGAEAKYLIADYLFDSGNDTKAEAEINDFIAQGTPYQYWLARAFVLLADIYIKRGDDFQAKQYLLSLQANYKREDSIASLIAERLDGIKKREDAAIIK